MPNQLPIRKVRDGEPVSAKWANQVVDAINRLASIRVGAGLEINVTEDGISINLAPGAVDRIPARIDATNAPIGEFDGIASAATYNVRASGRPDIPVQMMMVPKYGRPTVDDELHIHYAQPGDLCYLIPRSSSDEFGYDLEVVTEIGKFSDCDDLETP